MQSPFLIIDFDSTFVALESLDELARIALANSPNQTEQIRELSRITDLGMEGKIGFAESLQQRLKMFRANRQDIQQLIGLLSQHITPSIARHQDFFRSEAERIYIISGGFSDYIWPVVESFGLSSDHILANRFKFDAKGEVVGCDQSCYLAQNGGKVKQIAALQLEGPVYVIGDGYTDYQIKASGMAEKFLAFVENVRRESVIAHADQVVTSFDELVPIMQ